MASHVAIVLVNYHALDELAVALTSVRELTYCDRSVIVVDNEAQGDAERLAARFPEVEVLPQALNLGFAGGCNAGILHARNAGADHVLLLNIDVVVQPGMLEPMVAALESDPGIGACGPVMVDFDDERRVESAGVTMDYKGICSPLREGDEVAGLETGAPFDVPYLHGSAILVPARTIEGVGLLDERYFLNYEDIDYCERVRQHGRRLVIVPSARYRHKGNVTIGRSSPLGHYYLMRNRLLFLADHRMWRRFVPALAAAAVHAWPTRGDPWRTVTKRALADFGRGRFGRRPIGLD